MRFCLYFFALLCVLFSYDPLAWADTIPGESSLLSAEHATYKDNRLLLEGAVWLDHDFALMRADWAALEKEEEGSSFPFALISLKEQVFLDLKTEGTLVCDSAKLDFQTLKGSFWAKDQVIYKKETQNPHETSTPFCLKAKQMEFTLKDKDLLGKSYTIEEVRVEQKVLLEYQKGVRLFSDKALYTYHPEEKILCFPLPHRRFCQVEAPEGIIEAEKIEVFLGPSELVMQAPRGKLFSLYPLEAPLFFEGSSLHWRPLLASLTLQGPLWIKEPLLGTLTTDEEVTLLQKKGEKEAYWHKLCAKGHLLLQYQDVKQELPTAISCHGTLLLDKDTLHASLHSYAPLQTPICYQKGGVTIYTDSLELTSQKDQRELSHLSLEGNIRFTYQEGASLRSGWADLLTYCPATNTTILKALAGRKVLLWDKEEAMRISADEIHLIQSPQHEKDHIQKDHIQGIGNVQLTFSPEQDAFFQKIFPAYRSSHASP